MKKNRNRNAAARRREDRNAGAYTGEKAEERDREDGGGSDAGAEGAPSIQRRDMRIQEMPARETAAQEMPARGTVEQKAPARSAAVQEMPAWEAEMQEVTLRFGVQQRNDYRTKEAYKTLRTNIEFSGPDIRVIAVTSCTPNEGKSSVAMELARAFAEAGKKTALIDADLRKSVLMGRYKTGAVRRGLTHALIGRESLENVMCATNVPNLYIVFSGPVPPNPSELLGGARFESALEGLRRSFDYVIVDTPPLGSVIDAAVAARKCDGTILVIENNAISYRFVQRVKEQLDKTESRILGAVLNKVDMSAKGYYGHYGRYYGKYYGKYYGRYGEDAAPLQSDAPARERRERRAAGDPAEGKQGRMEDRSRRESGYGSEEEEGLEYL